MWCGRMVLGSTTNEGRIGEAYGSKPFEILAFHICGERPRNGVANKTRHQLMRQPCHLAAIPICTSALIQWDAPFCRHHVQLFTTIEHLRRGKGTRHNEPP